MTGAQVRFKAEDSWQTPDDGKRDEVIYGEIILSPAPSLPPQRGLSRLALFPANWTPPTSWDAEGENDGSQREAPEAWRRR